MSGARVRSVPYSRAGSGDNCLALAGSRSQASVDVRTRVAATLSTDGTRSLEQTSSSGEDVK